jgi:hypothetical protein
MAATSGLVHNLLACARLACHRYQNAHRTCPIRPSPNLFIIGEVAVALATGEAV